MNNKEELLEAIKDAVAKYSDDYNDPDFVIDIRIQCEDGWANAEEL